jgi:hypothetical protein
MGRARGLVPARQTGASGAVAGGMAARNKAGRAAHFPHSAMAPRDRHDPGLAAAAPIRRAGTAAKAGQEGQRQTGKTLGSAYAALAGSTAIAAAETAHSFQDAISRGAREASERRALAS